MEKEYREFSIRVSRQLSEVIQKDADQNKRSRNNQVNLVLEQHYAPQLEEQTDPVESEFGEAEVTAN